MTPSEKREMKILHKEFKQMEKDLAIYEKNKQYKEKHDAVYKQKVNCPTCGKLLTVSSLKYNHDQRKCNLSVMEKPVKPRKKVLEGGDNQNKSNNEEIKTENKKELETLDEMIDDVLNEDKPKEKPKREIKGSFTDSKKKHVK